ncbi:MAG TPA: diiron oxygenase [Sandaracinaceae bacterium LLY-WYZ-13_1]|nr:diiron oxygenase [Sandaracinaceae bacterium LLY-WYZ-13_1]
MSTANELAVRLTEQSRDQFWNVYTEFDWPEELSADRYCMPPELISIHGTELWDELNEEQRKRLSLYEVANFFSLTLQGERPLVAGLSDRLYSKRVSPEATEYLHHFIDEENKHMIMFGIFLNKYVGKVYPEKKVALEREYSKGEEELAFFCKVLVVEELGDYYNVKMMLDDAIEPIVKRINWVHHRDESRHLGFGRRHLTELAEHWLPKWDEETKKGFSDWLGQYVKSSWNDFYNPTMYKDAGLDKPYQVRKMALAHPATAEHRRKASKKLVNIFLRNGLLQEAPEL